MAVEVTLIFRARYELNEEDQYRLRDVVESLVEDGAVIILEQEEV